MKWAAVMLVFLAGCAAPTVNVPLEVSNCDPRLRDDCWSISKETFDAMYDAYEESEKLRAAYKFCRDGI